MGGRGRGERGGAGESTLYDYITNTCITLDTVPLHYHQYQGDQANYTYHECGTGSLHNCIGVAALQKVEYVAVSQSE